MPVGCLSPQLWPAWVWSRVLRSGGKEKVGEKVVQGLQNVVKRLLFVWADIILFARDMFCGARVSYLHPCDYPQLLRAQLQTVSHCSCMTPWSLGTAHSSSYKSIDRTEK